MDITERLERDLREALRRLRRLADDIAEQDAGGTLAESESVSDVVDAAQGAAERDMHFATRSLLQARARRLAAALARLGAGRYGTCDECDGAIAPARLAALPEVTTCLACQTRRERGSHAHQPRHAPAPVHRHRSHHGGPTGRRARRPSLPA